MKAPGVGRHAVQISSSRTLEERGALPFEAVGLIARPAQPLAGDLEGHVEEHRAIRALASLHPVFEDGDGRAANSRPPPW